MAADDDDDDKPKRAKGDEDDSSKKRKPEKSKGGMSTGMILGIVGVLLLCCVCFPAGGGIAFAIFGTGMGGLMGSANRAATMNDMRQIGLAAHGYHDTNKAFPSPRLAGAELSWRVALLPFLEQGPLFQQFDMARDCDHVPNQAHLSKLPKTYHSGLHPALDPTQTAYQYFTGANTLFPQPGSKIKMTAIKDGASSTILVSESMVFVPWSKPADMTAGAMLTVPNDQYVVCMVDGTAKVVNPPRLSDPDLRGLINPSDGKGMPPGF